MEKKTTESTVCPSNTDSRYDIEERLECADTHQVRYTKTTNVILSLPIPMDAAENKAEVCSPFSRLHFSAYRHTPAPNRHALSLHLWHRLNMEVVSLWVQCMKGTVDGC